MIKANSVVEISYVLKNITGEELDRADAKEPLVYLHGSGQIVPGLEKALDGLTVGTSKEVSLPPQEGYGEIDPKLKLKTDISIFPQDVDVKVGMEFSADLGDGKTQHFRVAHIEKNDVFIDGNHPLAGQTLNFSVEIISIRKATQEELSHGHAHGPGGHKH
tara:strand:- start:444 stop:926 length:483 start_codon:yes stop_codon:yes gene_type:complete